MMVTQAKEPYTAPEEYLALERNAEFKSEYFDGRIFAMAGATRAHNLITGNAVRDLGTQLKGRPCEVYPSDMRVKVSPTGLYTYPDVVVVCGEARFEDDHEDTLLNPTVIIEVLSESTEAYDRGEKFAHYRTLESLTDYVLIAQDKPRIEHFIRQSDKQWLFSATSDLQDTLRLVSLGCGLRLSEVYDKVRFKENVTAKEKGEG